jgi:hypothetical protein
VANANWERIFSFEDANDLAELMSLIAWRTSGDPESSALIERLAEHSRFGEVVIAMPRILHELAAFRPEITSSNNATTQKAGACLRSYGLYKIFDFAQDYERGREVIRLLRTLGGTEERCEFLSKVTDEVKERAESAQNFPVALLLDLYRLCAGERQLPPDFVEFAKNVMEATLKDSTRRDYVLHSRPGELQAWVEMAIDMGDAKLLFMLKQSIEAGGQAPGVDQLQWLPGGRLFEGFLRRLTRCKTVRQVEKLINES